jgi:YbbR domain-containing protein
MLGAVAFSQNPPTTKTLTVPVHYVPGPNLVLINPPTKTTVTVNGLADLIGPLTADSIVAVVDATKANPGPDVRLNVVARAPNGVNVTQPLPFAVNIDRITVTPLTVQVVDHPAPGWEVTKSEARCPTSPCVVNFSGPASWEVNLKALAVFPNAIDNSSYDVLTQQVVLQQGNTALDPGRLLQTVPTSSLDITTVSLHVEARTGTTSRSVPVVDSAPLHPPPAGYRITGILFDPVNVVVTGPADKLAQLANISLPPVDLSSSTTNATFRLQIPYPSGMSGSVATAKLTYLISANPNVSPSP